MKNITFKIKELPPITTQTIPNPDRQLRLVDSQMPSPHTYPTHPHSKRHKPTGHWKLWRVDTGWMLKRILRNDRELCIGVFKTLEDAYDHADKQ